MLYFIFISSLLIFGGWSAKSFSHQREYCIRSYLEKIPIQEKHSLENFFKCLVCSKYFGYVIFGSKPMVWEDFYSNVIAINLNYMTISNFYLYDSIALDFKCWKKYQHLFPMKKYILRIVEDPDEPSNYIIIFINKKNFLNIVSTYLDHFKKVLGDDITPESLMAQVQTKTNILNDVLRGNHQLFGLLLGFGWHNTSMFQKREVLRHKLKSDYKPPYDWNCVMKVYDFQLTCFYDYDLRSLFYIRPPAFLEDLKNRESYALSKDYLNQWKRLHDIYSNDSFLEITLEALTSDAQEYSQQVRDEVLSSNQVLGSRN
jgi:hypothetical protein